LLIEIQAVTRKGNNDLISLRGSASDKGSVEGFLRWISRRHPHHALIFAVGQDHVLRDAEGLRELIRPLVSQWLIDLVTVLVYRRRQGLPLRCRLAVGGPNCIHVAPGWPVGSLLPEKFCHLV